MPSTLNKKEVDKRYRKNNKEKIQEANKKRRYEIAVGHAKARKKIFTLTKEEFYEIYNQNCFYCNSVLGQVTGLDRFDNDKGYEIGNVAACCKLCNYSRGFLLSVEEWQILAQVLIMLRRKIFVNK